MGGPARGSFLGCRSELILSSCRHSYPRREQRTNFEEQRRNNIKIAQMHGVDMTDMQEILDHSTQTTLRRAWKSGATNLWSRGAG